MPSSTGLPRVLVWLLGGLVPVGRRGPPARCEVVDVLWSVSSSCKKQQPAEGPGAMEGSGNGSGGDRERETSTAARSTVSSRRGLGGWHLLALPLSLSDRTRCVALRGKAACAVERGAGAAGSGCLCACDCVIWLPRFTAGRARTVCLVGGPW